VNIPAKKCEQKLDIQNSR